MNGYRLNQIKSVADAHRAELMREAQAKRLIHTVKRSEANQVARVEGSVRPTRTQRKEAAA